MGNQLLLVGSIPFDTVEDVFRTFGARLGPFLAALPDGEVGPRSHWISRVHYQVFAAHADLEILGRPAPEDGVERLHPRGPQDRWNFGVKAGVERVRFTNPGWRLGFAADAINSYFIFRTLREKGVLPEGLRFQVSMPMVNSVTPSRVFPVAGDLEKIRPGYEAALKAELENIVARIPAEDLAIQWDCASELQDAYPAQSESAGGGGIEHNLGQVRRLASLVPEKALLGYHLCFGTLGGWPRFAPDDLSGAVELANALVEQSGRSVDWIHIPVLDGRDDSFVAPLAGLRPRAARVYLGMVHHMEGFAQRVAAARRFLPEFGVGAYCGFGRLEPDGLLQILADHERAMGALYP